MKKVLNLILLSLILTINAIELVELKTDKVFKFSSDQEAQESIDYTACLELLKNEEFMEKLKQFIEEEGYPEDYDINEIALTFCQQMSQENEEIQSQTKQLINKLKTEETNNIAFYKPVDIKKDIKDLATTIFMPPSPIPKDIILKEGDNWWKRFWRKVRDKLADLLIEIVVTVIRNWILK